MGRLPASKIKGRRIAPPTVLIIGRHGRRNTGDTNLALGVAGNAR